MTKNEFTLTQEYLKECFDYNPYTGVMIWRHRPVEHFKTEAGYNSFNDNHSGNVAGYLRKHPHGKYRYIKINDVKYSAYRLILIMEYGIVPEQVDHINGNTEDNSLENLRYATSEINNRNRRLTKANKTGIMGFHFCKTHKAFIVKIGNKGKKIFLGQRVDFFEACCLRKSAEVKLCYHENHGRR